MPPAPLDCHLYYKHCKTRENEQILQTMNFDQSVTGNYDMGLLTLASLSAFMSDITWEYRLYRSDITWEYRLNISDIT